MTDAAGHPSSAYHPAIDWTALNRDFPAGPGFLATYQGMDREQLRVLQEQRLQRVLDTAAATPFYQRLWAAAGIARADLRSSADLVHLPVIDKSMILADIEEHPPFGSLARRVDRPRGPAVLQTTSGTTGSPQPVLWGPWGREAQNALLGRTYQWLGVNADDVVHSVYGHGLVNGGHYVREAVTHYTEALMLSAGTGIETRSERQIAVMRQFGVTVLIGFADYLRKLADIARESGDLPHLRIRLIIGHLLEGGREPLEQAWGGARAFNWYGVADTGIVASEGPARDGLHVWEDANILEILDEEHRPLADGGVGDMVITSLCKSDLAPLIRFNTHDVSQVLEGEGEDRLPFRRIAGLLGRSDNMVKLKGINVYPSAIGGMLVGVTGFTGEYVCRRESDGHAERLVVVVEVAGAGGVAGAGDSRVTVDGVRSLLTTRLGVGVEVELVAPGATAALTGLHERQKPQRLVDARG